MTMAMTMLTTEDMSDWRPKARPSKIECTERAIIRMKGVMLGQQLVFALTSYMDVLMSASAFVDGSPRSFLPI